MPQCRYKVEPRTESVGGGYQLRLFEDDTEGGGGVSPADRHTEPHKDMAWFKTPQ
ncbi:hypothetical protein V4C53_17990 [Paraburkholderia azotifigens]|uniref:hypothetical protein n=1 Tax=Paraburkholderia azotifigens TaxID=2057004 RepID=UPI0031806ECB